MPEELKEQILPLLMSIFPDELKYTDSKKLGEQFTYESVHFTWYNRFAKGVSLRSKIFLNMRILSFDLP